MALALPLCGVACGSLHTDVAKERHPDFAVERARQWVELKRQKAELRPLSYDPHVFVTPGHGTVSVRFWALEGGPGWEYVRAKFTYTNTTDREFDAVHVRMIVRNHDGSRQSSSEVRLEHPLGLLLRPGTMFVDEIRTPTAGLHRDPQGWSWTMECRGIEPPDTAAARRSIVVHAR